LQVAGLEGEPELQLAPDFADVVAGLREVLSVPEIAAATGVKERQVHHWASAAHSPKGQARSRLLVLHQVVGQLRLAMGTEQIKVWLFSPYPELGGRPIDSIVATGGFDVLRAARELSLRSSVDDEYLVEIAKRGNASAYDALVERYRGFAHLKASSYAQLDGNPDDLIQEGLLGLYKAIRDFRPDRESGFRNFAELCITRQIIVAIKTAARTRRPTVSPQLEQPKGSPGDLDRASDTRTQQAKMSEPQSQRLASEELERLISSFSGVSGVLSNLESSVLSLYFYGYTQNAIAEQLGCDVKTVDDALQRVKHKVGQYLASDKSP